VHIYVHAEHTPDKPALRMAGSGLTVNPKRVPGGNCARHPKSKLESESESCRAHPEVARSGMAKIL